MVQHAFAVQGPPPVTVIGPNSPGPGRGLRASLAPLFRGQPPEVRVGLAGGTRLMPNPGHDAGPGDQE